MPFLQSSGQISIANLNSFFPGSGTSMSNFYRGGGRVPTTKTVSNIVREPASGEYFNSTWQGGSDFAWVTYTNNPNITGMLFWNSGGSAFQIPSPAGYITSFTSGIYTYYRGSFRAYFGKNNDESWYGVYRTSGSSSTVSINTGIPSSGQISLSQFYGAETP